MNVCSNNLKGMPVSRGRREGPTPLHLWRIHPGIFGDCEREKKRPAGWGASGFADLRQCKVVSLKPKMYVYLRSEAVF